MVYPNNPLEKKAINIINNFYLDVTGAKSP
jgi:hypothetical protein